MTGKLVSLSRARKARDREARRAAADANAAKFGRTRTEKARDKAEAARDAARLDGHKRDGE